MQKLIIIVWPARLKAYIIPTQCRARAAPPSETSHIDYIIFPTPIIYASHDTIWSLLDSTAHAQRNCKLIALALVGVIS